VSDQTVSDHDGESDQLAGEEAPDTAATRDIPPTEADDLGPRTVAADPVDIAATGSADRSDDATAQDPDRSPAETAHPVPEPSARPDPLRPPAPAPAHQDVAHHGGPGVEPGGDDELDTVPNGPSPTYPHDPVSSAGHPVPAPPHAATTHAVAPASAQPARWGRVDADGTVYVRTADGERAVGSWQAGEPEEGLAHYARRFDDVLTEVELLLTRLSVGGGDPRQALTSARALRDGLGEAHVVGDVAGLATLLDSLVAQAEQAVGAQRAERDAARAAAVTRKEALAAEAETLAVEATQWKQAGDRFKAILDEWRTIRGVDRKTDELLWKRFSKAREAFNRRRGSHFAELDRQRAGARARKEEIALEAEKLAESDEWGPTAARFRDLMGEWKAAGRAQKDADDALWQRFRAAQDTFFSRRAQTFAERDAEFDANAAAKRALLDEAEKIDVSDPDAARAALRSVQERWEAIGKVPRDDIRPLEARMRTVEEKVREAVDRQWRRTDPEAEARVAQFRERVAQFESQAAKARAGGDARRAAQAQAQADQWREWLATAEQSVQQR
jgi:Domain of Unknown Function (DUF349)